MLYYTILYYTILYYTILYYTILYYIIFYSTLLQEDKLSRRFVAWLRAHEAVYGSPEPAEPSVTPGPPAKVAHEAAGIYVML